AIRLRAGRHEGRAAGPRGRAVHDCHRAAGRWSGRRVAARMGANPGVRSVRQEVAFVPRLRRHRGLCARRSGGQALRPRHLPAHLGAAVSRHAPAAAPRAASQGEAHRGRRASRADSLARRAGRGNPRRQRQRHLRRAPGGRDRYRSWGHPRLRRPVSARRAVSLRDHRGRCAESRRAGDGIPAPRAAGWLAGIAYATMLLPLVYARTAIFDSTLTLCTTAAILWFFEERPVLAWAAMAAGALTKGPLAIALPLLVLVPHALATGLPLRRLFSWRAVGAFALIALPWFIAVSIRVPAFPYYVVVRETLQRVTTGTFHRTAPYWYFFPIVPVAA